MKYVTYDESGYLTGSYDQDLPQSHTACHIEVTEQQRKNWTSFRANDARDGLVELPAPTPSVMVPDSVTRRQARQALLLQGLLAGVQPLIDAIPDATQKAVAQIYWDDAQDYERSNQWVITLGAGLGLSPSQIDSLFIEASAL